MSKHEKGLIDWPVIEIDYVTSTSSLGKLAKKYGVGNSAIQRESSLRNWVDKRKDYQCKLIEKITAQAMKEKALKVNAELKAVNAMTDAVNRALEDPDYLYCHLVKTNTGEMFEQDSRVLNSKALAEITTSMEKLSNMKNMYNRIITESEQQKLQLERDRFEHQKVMDAKRIELEMEKLKLAGGGGDENDHSSGLVFLPPRLEREEDE